jgi:hypothetical protein
MNEEKNENKIAEALALQESGTKNAELLKQFPDIKDELSEIFKLQAVLKAEKEEISPSKTLLSKILAQIPGETKPKVIEEVRVKPRHKTPVASPYAQEVSVSVRFRRFIYAAPVAALVAVVLVVGMRGGKNTGDNLAITKQDAPSPQMETMSLKQAAPYAATDSATGAASIESAALSAPPPATGNIDDAVAAIIAGSEAEQQTLREHDQATLAGNDTGLIDDIDNVDENAY